MARKPARRAEASGGRGRGEQHGMGLWALGNPAAWAPVEPRVPFWPNGPLPDSAKRQLQAELDEVYRALLKNARAGDAISGAVAAQIALSKASLS